MLFSELIATAGGPGRVAEASEGGVSRSHLANIVARRKRLTPDVVAAIRPQFPHVTEGQWLDWLVERPEESATNVA